MFGRFLEVSVYFVTFAKKTETYIFLIYIQDNDMADRLRELLVGIVIAVVAYLKPIDGELKSLAIIFLLNFVFGYLSGMIANGERFSFKKAVVCVGHATVFFVLCASIYTIGRLKGQMEGAVQCVSMITYVVIYFYGMNISQKMMEIFKEGTPPWMVANFIHYCLGLYFFEKIPVLSSFFNSYKQKKGVTSC